MIIQRSDKRTAVVALFLTVILIVALWWATTSLATSKSVASLSNTDLPESLDKAYKVAGWHPTGGPYEQIIYALALGTSPEILYAGTWGRGLYRSDDGGRTWQPTTQSLSEDETDLKKALVVSLVVLPDDQTIYLSNWGNSVFCSSDRGMTWNTTVSFMPSHNRYYAKDLLLDQDNPNVIYQATWGGIYTKKHGDDSWTGRDVDPEVEWKKKRVEVLAQAEDGTLYAGTLGSGIYRSVDQGENWQAIGPQEPDLARQVHSLVVQGDQVWTGTRNGVYHTSNVGLTWTQMITGFADDPRARRIQAMALDSEENLYAGTVDYGVYRSEDRGETWQPYNDGITGYASSILDLVYDARVNVLYATTYGSGIYRNAGKGWEPINGNGITNSLPTPAVQILSLAFAGPEQKKLLVGTLVGGVYASDDRGKTWQRWIHALPVGAARNVADIVVLDDGQTIVLAGGTGLYRSEDNGKSFIKVQEGLPEGDHRVISLVQSQRDPHLLFAALEQAGDDSLYRSTDGGKTWQFYQQFAEVDDLAISHDDQSLFGIELGRGLFRSTNQQVNWLGSGLIPHSKQVVIDARNLWQQLVLGYGYCPQSLHVLALDGIYRSCDGDNWQPSLRGQFQTLLADPVRPGVLYATAMTDTVPAEIVLKQEKISEDSETSPFDTPGLDPLNQKTHLVTETVSLSDARQYPFWISLDDGRSWQQASTSDRRLTVLALDPLDHDQLLAGTYDNGVYVTQLSLPSLYTTGLAPLRLAAFVILPTLSTGALIGLYLYFLLGLRISLYPWQVWGLLLRIPAWRLVSTLNSQLDAMEKLVTSVAADLESHVFSFDMLWDKLQNLGAIPAQSQVHDTLSSLQAHGLFRRDAQGQYHFTLVALARLATRNFDRDALIDQVRSANLILSNTETFFDQAGFQVTTLLDRLFLWPESPHYRALGWLNVWLHNHRPLDEPNVQSLIDRSGNGSHDLGFVVLDDIPIAEAYQAMQAAHLIPLSSSEIERAVHRREAGLILDRIIREGQGQENLFSLKEPLLDHLALFGRSALLSNWLDILTQKQNFYFWGLPRSGRTSALWWLRRNVPSRWLKGYTNLRFRILSWPSILRDLLSNLLVDLRQVHSRLLSLPELDDILAACGSEQDLSAGLDYLIMQGSPRPPQRFIFFLDGALPSAVMDKFQDVAAKRTDLSLVVSWDRLPSDPSTANGEGWLSPLTYAESQTLLKTTGARIGLHFEESDVALLFQASGGHPYLLRQLGSQAAQLAGRPDQTNSNQVLQPGEWPDMPAPVSAPASAAIQTYVQTQSDTLKHIWQAMPAEVRWNVRLLAAGRSLDPALEPSYAAMGLLDRDKRGASSLRIGLLAQWLQERQQ